MCKRAGLPGQVRGFTLVELLVVIRTLLCWVAHHLLERDDDEPCCEC